MAGVESRKSVIATTYLFPPTKKRMERIQKKNHQYTISRQLNEAIESHIDRLEEQVGIRPRKPGN